MAKSDTTKPTKVKAVKPTANRVGRPTKYKPEYCQELIDSFRQGYGVFTFADKIGINEDTFRAWLRDFPEFSVAFKSAKAAKGRWFEDIAQNHTVSYEKGPRVNTGLFTFMARVQLGWGEDTKPTEVNLNIPQWNTQASLPPKEDPLALP